MRQRWHRFWKRLLVLTAILVLALAAAGCETPLKKTPPPSPATFSANVTVAFGETLFKALVFQEVPGNLTCAFSAPEELKGLELALSGETATLRYGELTKQWDTKTLPETGFVPILSQVLLQLAQPQANAKPVKTGGWQIDGMASGEYFTALLREDGALKQVTVPAIALTIGLEYD